MQKVFCLVGCDCFCVSAVNRISPSEAQSPSLAPEEKSPGWLDVISGKKPEAVVVHTQSISFERDTTSALLAGCTEA
jgi:hypothetical protein